MNHSSFTPDLFTKNRIKVLTLTDNYTIVKKCKEETQFSYTDVKPSKLNIGISSFSTVSYLLGDENSIRTA